MSTKIEKELFIGKYYPFEAVAALPKGSIVDGKNLLRKSIFGAWTPRKGYTLINTTSNGSEFLSIHKYTNPFFFDYHLIVQVGSELYSLAHATETLLTDDDETLTTEAEDVLLVTTTAEPLSQRTTLGSSLFTVGDRPGFSCIVGEDWIYCDGYQRPIIYGGDTPRCDGFMVYEGATGTYIDYTGDVTDQDLDTAAIITANASTVYYVGMKERGSEIHLIFGSVNTNAVTPTVKAYRTAGWTDVSATDGTDGTQTHDTDAALTWSASALDLMTVIGNRQLFWYQVSFDGAPTEITVKDCRVVRAMSLMTNKWDGEFEYVTGALFYDLSATEYIDKLGSVTDDAQSTYMDISSMQTGDYIYFKTVEPLLGIGFKMVEGNINTANAQIDLIETITSAGWATVGTFDDKTLDAAADSSFATDGVVWVTLEHEPQLATFQGDQSPGYWYRVSCDAALSATTQIAEIVYAAWPKALHAFDGCVEFDSRLILWGEPQYRNRLLISPRNRPDLFAFIAERYSFPFGASDKILNAAVMENYLMVFKRKGIYLSDRNFAEIPTVLSLEIGLASVKTVQVISTGDRTLKEDETKTMVMWQDRDGVYKATENGLITKVSDQVKNYFNPYEDEYIGDENITNRQAAYDKVTDTYRLFLPDRTLCYSVGTAEWLPEWYYNLTPSTALFSLGPEGESICIYGTVEGFLVQAERVRNDRTSGNERIAIEHYFTTRPLYVDKEEMSVAIAGTLRKLWVEALADSGTYEITLYVNRATTGSALSTPSAPSLIDTTHAVKVQKFDLGSDNVNCFQLKFRSYPSTPIFDQTLEVYSISYQIDALRTKQ